MKLIIEVNDDIYKNYKESLESQDILKDIEEVTTKLVESSMKNSIKIYDEFEVEL